MEFIKIAIFKILTKIFSFLFPRPAKPEKIKNIAIISTTGLGDSIWAIPAFKALKSSFPEAKITALLSPIGKEVLLNNPWIDEVIVHTLFSFWQLYFRLRRKKLDAILIFHASKRQMFQLSKLINPHYIIGTLGRSKESDFILTHAVKPHFHEHEIQRRINIVLALGGKQPISSKLEVFLTDEERKEANFFLKSMNISPKDVIIGINPGSKDVFKRWPKEYFIDFAKQLQSKLNCKIVITGSMYESNLVKSISKEIPHSIPLFGQISLRVMMGIMEKMDLYLSNDTGPMHIAFALNIPTIGLFSPTHPDNCGPLQVNNAIVEYVNRCCFPCLGRKCKDPFCMRQISKEVVLKHALSILHPSEKFN